MTPQRTHASAGPAAGKDRARSSTLQYMRAGVWHNVCVKRVFEFVHNSPSHLIIPVTFLCSFLLSSLSSLSCFQARDQLLLCWRWFFFFLCLNSPHRIWPLLTCPVQVFWSYPHCLAVWSFCPPCLLYGSFGLARSGTAGSGFTLCSASEGGVGCWLGEVLGAGGGGGEMERIMEGSLHPRLLQRKLLILLSGSFQDLLLHLKWQLLLGLD